MDSREMPAALAAWKMVPSTSMLTALVHSSSSAYLGLQKQGEEGKTGWVLCPPGQEEEWDTCASRQWLGAAGAL